MSIKITTQQISMRYKERVLFHIPELSIGPNDAIYLKGDNGVGKTTLLKILSGLIKPSSGRIQSPIQSWQQILFPRLKFKDIIYLHQTPYLLMVRCTKMSLMAFALTKRAKKISELK